MHCPYCGNNQVPHTITLINDYLALLNKPLEWLGSSRLGQQIERFFSLLGPPLVRLAAAGGMITFNTDSSKAPNGRSQVIWEEAQRRSIPMKQLVFFGKPLDTYIAKLPNRTIVFNSLPVPAKLQTSAIRWMDDKLKLKKKLMAAGIPVARGGAFMNFAPMLRLFRQIDKPVIVKPAVGSRGRHTTTFIYTEEQLKKAFDIGKQLARSLVMEEHLTGSVYRGTIIGDKLVGVLRGDPPRVTGDGTSTITQLIAKKNAAKHPKVKDVVVTALTKDFLARSSYTIESVLPKDKIIDLTEKIGISYGGFAAEDFTITHPKTKQILERAGRAVNFPTMGFDFIIQDITKDPDEQKWGIIECNSLPFIDLHHHPLQGEPVNAASAVWDFWEVSLPPRK